MRRKGSLSICLHILVLSHIADQAKSLILSRDKAISASSTYSNWSPEKALDGNVRRDADQCGCCAGTLGWLNPWYNLDLGKRFTVNRIHVEGRDDNNGQHFQGMQIYLKSVYADFSIGEETRITEATYNVNFVFPEPKSSRFVSLVLYNENRVFTICQLTVYGECVDGEFGNYCEHECHCYGDPCNKSTGVCPSGKCLPGYQGTDCYKVCPDGTYGTGCTESCGNCSGSDVCNKQDGRCPDQCASGYQGDTCKQVLDIPNNLNVDNVQSRSFMVSWTKPTNTNGENMGYIVQVRTVDDACVTELIITCMGCTQSFNPSSLENMCPNGVSITEQRTKTSIDSDDLQTYTVTSLNPYVNYTVIVTAVTFGGRGRIASVTVQTDEEGLERHDHDSEINVSVVAAAVIVPCVVGVIVVIAVALIIRRRRRQTWADQMTFSKIHDDSGRVTENHQNTKKITGITDGMEHEEVMAWMHSNEFIACKKHFKHYTGKDMLELSKDDVARICGAADGIRLFNRMRQRTLADVGPQRVSEGDLNTLYADLDETTRDRVPYENIELNEAHMYSSLN